MRSTGKYPKIVFILTLTLLASGCAHRIPPPSKQGSSHKIEIFKKMSLRLKSYLGVPYRYGGTSMDGLDCSGLAWRIYHDIAGITLPRRARDMYGQGYPVLAGRWKFGDLLFFSINGRGIAHVGIYLGGRRFQHVSKSSGTIISSLDEPYYSQRFSGARRIIR